MAASSAKMEKSLLDAFHVNAVDKDQREDYKDVIEFKKQMGKEYRRELLEREQAEKEGYIWEGKKTRQQRQNERDWVSRMLKDPKALMNMTYDEVQRFVKDPVAKRVPTHIFSSTHAIRVLEPDEALKPDECPQVPPREYFGMALARDGKRLEPADDSRKYAPRGTSDGLMRRPFEAISTSKSSDGVIGGREVFGSDGGISSEAGQTASDGPSSPLDATMPGHGVDGDIGQNKTRAEWPDEANARSNRGSALSRRTNSVGGASEASPKKKRSGTGRTYSPDRIIEYHPHPGHPHLPPRRGSRVGAASAPPLMHAALAASEEETHGRERPLFCVGSGGRRVVGGDGGGDGGGGAGPNACFLASPSSANSGASPGTVLTAEIPHWFPFYGSPPANGGNPIIQKTAIVAESTTAPHQQRPSGSGSGGGPTATAQSSANSRDPLSINSRHGAATAHNTNNSRQHTASPLHPLSVDEKSPISSQDTPMTPPEQPSSVFIHPTEEDTNNNPSQMTTSADKNLGDQKAEGGGKEEEEDGEEEENNEVDDGEGSDLLQKSRRVLREHIERVKETYTTVKERVADRAAREREREKFAEELQPTAFTRDPLGGRYLTELLRPDGMLPRKNSRGLSLPKVDAEGCYHNIMPGFTKPNFACCFKYEVAMVDMDPPKQPSREEAAVLLPSTDRINLHAVYRNNPWGCPCEACVVKNKAGGLECARANGIPLPIASPSNEELAATWCSHASYIVTVGGLTILSDPVWSDRCSPVQMMGPMRMVPVPIALHDMPYVDAVTISHNHYDHLCTTTIRHLCRHNHNVYNKKRRVGKPSAELMAKLEELRHTFAGYSSHNGASEDGKNGGAYDARNDGNVSPCKSPLFREDDDDDTEVATGGASATNGSFDNRSGALSQKPSFSHGQQQQQRHEYEVKQPTARRNKLRAHTHPVFVVPMGMKKRYFAPLTSEVPELNLDLVVEVMWWDTADVTAAVYRNRRMMLARLSMATEDEIVASGEGMDANFIPPIPPLLITVVPAQHWSMRQGLWDRDRELWGSFVYRIGHTDHLTHRRAKAEAILKMGDVSSPTDDAEAPFGPLITEETAVGEGAGPLGRSSAVDGSSADSHGLRVHFEMGGQIGGASLASQPTASAIEGAPLHSALRHANEPFASPSVPVEGEPPSAVAAGGGRTSAATKEQNSAHSTTGARAHVDPTDTAALEKSLLERQRLNAAVHGLQSRFGTHKWTLFHSGDTGYYDLIYEEIFKAFGAFDFCMIAIGAYEPRKLLRQQHLDPIEAVEIHDRLRSRRSAAMHWGTWILSDEPIDEPPKLLSMAMSEKYRPFAHRLGYAPTSAAAAHQQLLLGGSFLGTSLKPNEQSVRLAPLDARAECGDEGAEGASTSEEGPTAAKIRLFRTMDLDFLTTAGRPNTAMMTTAVKGKLRAIKKNAIPKTLTEDQLPNKARICDANGERVERQVLTVKPEKRSEVEYGQWHPDVRTLSNAYVNRKMAESEAEAAERLVEGNPRPRNAQPPEPIVSTIFHSKGHGNTESAVIFHHEIREGMKHLGGRTYPFFDCANPFRVLMHGETWVVPPHSKQQMLEADLPNLLAM